MIILSLWSGCTNSYTESPTGEDTQEQIDTGITEDISTPLEEEICDGIDNDGDLIIDEGFDTDKDGIADCFQCNVTKDEYNELEDGTEFKFCQPTIGIYEDDFNNLTEEWSLLMSDLENDASKYDGFGCYNPAIININSDGFSDIICGSALGNEGRNVYAFSGRDGSRIWSSTEFTDLPGVVVGDLNSDGSIDVAGLDKHGYMVAVNTYSDKIIWRTKEPASSTYNWQQPCYYRNVYSPASSNAATNSQLFDLDKDGDWEIVTWRTIIDARSGYTRAIFDHEGIDDDCFYDGVQRHGFEILAGDVNGDNVDEIIMNNKVFNMNGELLWSAEIEPFIYLFGRTIVERDFYSSMLINFDSDEYPEIVFIDSHQYRIYDGDGTLLFSRSIHQQSYAEELLNIGYSCSADADGDGEPDIIIPTGSIFYGDTFLTAWDKAGDIIWQKDVTINGLGSCTSFDFNNDGQMEIIFGGSNRTDVLNGQTGETLYSIPKSKSLSDPIGPVGPINSTSMFVDLDGDGSSEWIMASVVTTADGEPALRVLSHADNAWGPGGRIWPWSHWSGSGMHGDGTPQNDQPPPWISPGRFRSQADVHIDGADLRPVVYDSCEAEAESRLSIAVANLGPFDVGDTFVLTVADSAGAEIFRERLVTNIAAQHRTETYEVVLTPQQAQDGVTIQVEAEDEHDCDVTNNALSWQAE